MRIGITIQKNNASFVAKYADRYWGIFCIISSGMIFVITATRSPICVKLITETDIIDESLRVRRLLAKDLFKIAKVSKYININTANLVAYISTSTGRVSLSCSKYGNVASKAKAT